ncbi:hypothetical protein K435DRAFT_818524 [Dendrothele bispora CBS 962.96]|uniref:Mandelate racemase/muconate lactonizing enzyme N-terminal domain-containing protein n=1 Tax=Dendrothele bispora (strain CBS 962.96) TaxID=1314807 RepID=A0A4V4HGP2_DENBC|nr:hypothetical protein K435DRAFT_818524 [Dendrothele bispora CBS 962.96]
MSSKCTIAKIETFRVPPNRWLFVRVETNDGIVGWGESTLEGHTEAIEGAFSDLRRFIGVEADNIVDIWQEAYMGRFYRGGPVLMSALSGLDIALWDIKGKRHGIPVWKRKDLRSHQRDQPSDVLDTAKNRKAEGFTCVKMNATDIVARIDSPEVLRGTVERVQQLQSVGLGVGIDFHGHFHKGMAKQLAKLLEPLHPLFIEGIDNLF